MQKEYIRNEVEAEQYKNFISRMVNDLIKMNFSDTVEVVRCKDCISWSDRTFGLGICAASGIKIESEDFCSQAIKTEGEE